ncbi:hypothetical protein NDU88_004156 [Pleurodeles waltl]|uniref:Uncharacterized protein n=1 Tax=Pleurodeles waltl TaxID=8319 RepID=A0AAV7UGC5_PLEWA|nr:hypothetical protein NDU88_004156 [Pleurodeles waltl]
MSNALNSIFAAPTGDFRPFWYQILPLRVHAQKTQSEDLRAVLCACARMGMKRGLSPLRSEQTLIRRPAPAPHRSLGNSKQTELAEPKLRSTENRQVLMLRAFA